MELSVRMWFAKARSHPNIAFIKYWGNQNDALRLPANSSLSMNLGSLYTETSVLWRDDLAADTLNLNGRETNGQALDRVVRHLDQIRSRLQLSKFAEIHSHNNFPMGTGIASSASAFAALTAAAVKASGADLSERELSTLARLGSGSASRSIPGGFVVWHADSTHEGSYAEMIALPEHWDLVDVVAIVSEEHKRTTSSAGHPTAATSDLQQARVAGAEARLAACTQAVLERDFSRLAEVVEMDSNLMHAVMMTSRPALFYWKATTLTIMEAVGQWRGEGLEVCYTLDAGPNVHCICTAGSAVQVENLLREIPGIRDVLVSRAGIGTEIVEQK
jgi:diphosphomevalonate decarboxylase